MNHEQKVAVGTIVGQFVMFVSLYFLIEVHVWQGYNRIDRSPLYLFVYKHINHYSKMKRLDDESERNRDIQMWL